MKRFISVLSSLCLAATSLFSAFPAVTASAADKPTPASGTIEFDLLPMEGENDKDYTVSYADGANQITAEPGANLVLALYASNDPGCAGQLVYMDFSQVDFVECDVNSSTAYTGVSPTANAKYANTNDSLGQKYVSIVWVSTTTLKAKEGEPIAVFEVNVPNEKGIYTIGEKASVKVEVENGEVATRSTNVTTEDKKEVPYVFYGLTINAGGVQSSSSSSSSSSTSSSTTKSTTGSSGTTGTKAPTPTGTIQFDLLPMEGENDVDYTATFDGKNNVIEAKPGANIIMALYASNDPGCAGQLVYMDFSEVEFVEVDVNSSTAYTGVSPTANAKYANTNDSLGQKYVSVVWVSTSTLKAKEGEPIAVFEINVPNEKGIYTIGEKASVKVEVENGEVATRSTNVTTEDKKEVPYVFYGLTINAGGSTSSSNSSSQSSSQSTSGSTGTTGTKPTTPAGTIQFDLLPMEGENDVDYDVAFDGKNNVIKAQPGATIVMALYASNDPGCAGQLVYMDFSEVTFNEVDVNSSTAYTGVSPTANAKYANTNDSLGQKYVSVVWVSTTTLKAKEGEPIAVFEIEVPSAEGVYTISEKASVKVEVENGEVATRSTNVTTEDKKEVPYVFYGLTIDAGGESTTTSSTSRTSSSTTGSKPDTPTGTIQFDLLPMEGENDVEYKATFDGANNVITAKPGANIVMALYASNDPGCAGQSIYLDFSEVTFGECDVNSSTAYTGVSPTANTKYANENDYLGQKYVSIVWVSTSTLKAKEGEPIAVFEITVPNKEGTYTISETTITAEVENASGETVKVKRSVTVVPEEKGGANIPYVFYGLTINAKNAAETTTSSSSSSTETTTTTSSTPVAGTANWTIGTKTASAGDKNVTVPVTVKNDPGTAGFDVTFKYDTDALELAGITFGDAYTPASAALINAGKATVVWGDDKGANQKAADGAVVMNLVFNVKDSAAEGKHNIEFSVLNVENTDRSKLDLVKTNGWIEIGETTTTTTTLAPGTVGWTIGTTEAAKGATGVTVPVTVKGDPGTAGFDVTFKYDTDALVLTGITFGDAYTPATAALINTGKATVVWGDDKGANQTAADNAVVLNLVFDVKDSAAAGIHDVEFSVLNVENTDRNALTLEKTNGWVKVVDETTTSSSDTGTTTTESTTSSSGTTESTTSSSGDSETTTTTTTTLAPGQVGWYIGTTEAAKGQTGVTVPVTVKQDSGTAGFVVTFDYDKEALVLSAITFGDAYTPASAALINTNQLTVVWGDDNGANQKAADGAVVLNLVFDVKDTASAGKHNVTFSALSVENTDRNALDVVSTNGWILIPEETTTTETTTTTYGNTTDSTTSSSGSTESTTSSSGTTESTTSSSGSTESTTSSSGSTESTTSSSGSTESTTSSSGSTESTTSSSGSTESTTSSSGSTESTTSSSGSTESTTSSSGSTETTTTTSIPNPGHVVYVIGNVQANPGDVVKLPVNVLYDEGTAGFTMEFVLPEGFVITGVEYGDAYTSGNGEYLWNGDKNTLVWGSPDGLNQTAADGATIVTLLVQVPDNATEDTKYDVKFGEVKAEDTATVSLTPYTIDGSIYIKPQQTTTESTTTSSNTTESTTNTTPIPNPGHLVLNVGNGTVTPGGTADLPITVWFDDGSSEFTFKIDLPEGVTIEDIQFDPTYAANGTFTYDPETGVVTWTRNPDSDFVPAPGQTVAVVTVKVPEDAEPGTELPINLTELSAKDGAGNDVVPTGVGGKLTVTDGTTTSTTGTTTTTSSTETTTTTTGTTESTTTPTGTTETTTTPTGTTETSTTASTTESTTSSTGTTETTTNTTVLVTGMTVLTTYEISFKAPTRVNYWSHDPRSFKESGGLSGMTASITLYRYAVDENGYVYVTADATTPGERVEGVTYGATFVPGEQFAVKTLDVTDAVVIPDAQNSPLNVWENESKNQFGDAYISLDEVIGANVSKETFKAREAQEMAAEHANKYQISAMLDPTKVNDADFALGTEQIKLGEFNIHIAVKGDFNLDNRVDSKDAMETLKYYAETRLGRTYTLSNDPDLDGEDGLIFYLINVMYRQGKSANDPLEDPFEIKANDAQCILMYYGDRVVAGYYDTTWETVVGYDLLDSFYGDNYQ